MTIGEKIRYQRKRLNLTQTELGAKLGVKTNAVSKWECGRVEDIPTSKIKAMSVLFDVPTSYLIDDETQLLRAAAHSVYNQQFDALTEEQKISALASVQRPLPPSLAPLPAMREWPVLGATACGKPMHREMLDETVLAPDDIKADVVFRCVGDSMINARIFDGDAVFIRLQPEVENGQIAVVRIDDEYTLKRVYTYDGGVELRAENPTYPPIILRGNDLSPGNFEVVGLATAFLSQII